MLANPLKSFLYNFLLKKNTKRIQFPLKEKIWGWIKKSGYTLKTSIHGKKALIPSGYLYPEICRNITTFNNPLLELSWQTFQKKKSPLNIIDVGAAIGDTLFFLKQNLPAGSSTIYCIEGNLNYYNYLVRNAKKIGSGCVLINKVLSSENELIPELIHHHSSSLSSQGINKTMAFSLDYIWENEITSPVDILKIDVDGYDGKVIAGSTEILKKFCPSVIFEFHPLLIKETKNEFNLCFEVLSKNGYKNILWFDKFGNFISQKSLDDYTYIEEMIRQSLEGGPEKDIHFDIIAVGKQLLPVPENLSSCGYAKEKKYSY